jgi:hypothetical protein
MSVYPNKEGRSCGCQNENPPSVNIESKNSGVDEGSRHIWKASSSTKRYLPRGKGDPLKLTKYVPSYPHTMKLDLTDKIVEWAKSSLNLERGDFW